MSAAGVAQGVSAGVSAAGGIAGTILGAVARAQTRRAMEGLEAPEIDEELYRRLELGDPEALQVVLQAYPEIMDYEEDPRLKQAQMQALGQLSGVATEGFTPEDMAAIQAANLQAGTAARGAREAETLGARTRGVGGSGLEAMRRGQAQQAGINRMFGQAADIGMAGRQRALQGMQLAGQLGTGIRGQEWGQMAQRSGVQQAIDAGNIANRMSAQQFDLQRAQERALANQAANLEFAKAKEREAQTAHQLEMQKALYGEKK